MKWADLILPEESIEADLRGRVKYRKRGKYTLGCSGCPLNKPDKLKLIGIKSIRGRKAMLWGFYPSKSDMQAGRSWSGRESDFVWEELSNLDLERSDFDVQNIVRCRPTVNNQGYVFDREPTVEEIAHCSSHTQDALEANAGKASVHLVFGKEVAKEIFGKEFKASNPVFWSSKFKAKVFVLDPPHYLLRKNCPEWRFQEWKQRLSACAWAIHNPGRFAWLDHLKITPVYTASEFQEAVAKLCAKGERVAVDIEDGPLDGETVDKVLCIGFSSKKNTSFVAVLDHQENLTSEKEKQKLRDAIKIFLEDSAIEKIFHYGSYDSIRLETLMGITVKGYTFDTTYSHFLKYTFLRSHGLATIASLRYPHYAGYWDIIDAYFEGGNRIAHAPLKDLLKYNGADAALTKRIELDTRDDVSLPLLQIYIAAGRTLWKMEKRGPLLDREQMERAQEVIPERVKRLKARIRQVADDPELNPNTPAEIAYVLYTKLGLPTMAELSDDFQERQNKKGGTNKYSTGEAALNIIAEATKHSFPKDVLEYRRFSKMETTYLETYSNSANMHGGELRTKWFLTGAVTGRLRSGGSKDGYKGVINMQNLHGSPFLKNLLVSDTNWRTIYSSLPAGLLKLIDREPDGKEDPKAHKVWQRDLETCLATLKKIPEEILDLDVFLAFDYSQVEIRMLAECSKDPLLIKQFADGLDIHCAVGNTLNPAWTFEFIKKDKETRSFIKNCHFGLIYGLSEGGLYFYLKAKGVDTTPEKAAEFHRDYFRNYRGVQRFIERMQTQAVNEGFVDTLFGFRRRIGDEYDEDRQTNPMNQAVNSPIQGAAHTLLLAAMAMLDRFPKRFSLLQAPLMEVHDALVFKVKLRDLQAAYKQAQKLLEVDVKTYLKGLYGFELKVPLISEGSLGFRYGVMTDYAEKPLLNLLVDWIRENRATDKKMDKEFPLPKSA